MRIYRFEIGWQAVRFKGAFTSLILPAASDTPELALAGSQSTMKPEEKFDRKPNAYVKNGEVTH
jgi:hypothetical protein